MKKTILPLETSTEIKQWYEIDATGKHLGRLATEVSTILCGKNKAFYTPSRNIGDYVIITNAEKIIVTGNKQTQKLYFRHSGRPGGKTIETFQELQNRIPERIIEKAVKGMLPKNRLGRQLFRKLKVYKGSVHPHISQNPKKIQLS